MRDEELWDASTRIRSAFRAADWPPELREELTQRIAAVVSAGPVVVRSSSPQEDSDERPSRACTTRSSASKGSMRRSPLSTVWSSLYSERALMYRAELGFDVARAAMAVVVQPLATSERSGIAFTVSPVVARRRRDRGGVGTRRGAGERACRSRITGRWTALGSDPRAYARASRRDDEVVEGASKSKPSRTAVGLAAPLEGDEVDGVWALALNAEKRFGAPQDCEWTYHRGRQVLVQSRPITTLPPDSRTAWSRAEQSEERLIALGRRIEGELLPAMAQETPKLARGGSYGTRGRALVAERETRQRIRGEVARGLSGGVHPVRPRRARLRPLLQRQRRAQRPLRVHRSARSEPLWSTSSTRDCLPRSASNRRTAARGGARRARGRRSSRPSIPATASTGERVLSLGDETRGDCETTTTSTCGRSNGSRARPD